MPFIKSIKSTALYLIEKCQLCLLGQKFFGVKHSSSVGAVFIPLSLFHFTFGYAEIPKRVATEASGL